MTFSDASEEEDTPIDDHLADMLYSEKFYKKSNEEFDDGNYEESLHFINIAIKIHDSIPEYYEHRANILFETSDNIEDSIPDVNHAISIMEELYKESYLEAYSLARMYKLRSSINSFISEEQALLDAKKAYETFHSEDNLLNLCVRLHKGRKYHDIISLLKGRDLTNNLLLRRAKAYFRSGDYRSSLSDYEKIKSDTSEHEQRIKECRFLIESEKIDKIPEAAYPECIKECIQDLKCPITQSVFIDPVIASDSITYERFAILSVIKENGISPITREKLSPDLRTNYALKSIIDCIINSVPKKV